MKQIYKKTSKFTLSAFLKITLKNIAIVFLNVVCLSIYTLIFLITAYHFNEVPYKNISSYWLAIPIIGFILGIFQIHYIKSGSLISRTFVMSTICLAVFIIPIVISFII